MTITTDSLSGNKWSYLDDWYYQTDVIGVVVSKLSSKNLPNPNEVWQNKIAKSALMIGRELTIQERDSLRPRQYFFDLWEHKNA